MMEKSRKINAQRLVGFEATAEGVLTPKANDLQLRYNHGPTLKKGSSESYSKVGIKYEILRFRVLSKCT